MIGGTGQKRCSGSLDCNSLTAAMGSRTNKGCQGRGTHKGHDQIASSRPMQLFCAPGGTGKS